MQIIRPTLLLDKTKCIKNIKMMLEKAHLYGLDFRPHFKTHRSAEIAEWFRDAGINKCTVSSIEMAKYFAEHGWKDITIAFPVNLLEIENLNQIASEIQINILIDNQEIIQFLEENLTSIVGAFIKIDCGYHRCGIESQNVKAIESIILELNKSNKLNFKGLLTHSGNTYHAESTDEILKIHIDSKIQLIDIKSKLKLNNCIISVGDTPSCSLSESFDGIDEIRPGNFVFYDAMQLILGSCSFEQIAVCLACPVVAMNNDRKEVIIYGGSIHLSKENCKFKDKIIYGLVAELSETGWQLVDNAYVKSLSQEHGVLSIPENYYHQFKIGNTIGIIPVHSCLTVGLLQNYYELQSDKIITAHHDNN